MHVLYAPDSYGGFLTAPEACARVHARLWHPLQAVGVHLHTHPLADGGEGTLETLRHHGLVSIETIDTTGPEGRPRRARVGRPRGAPLGDTRGRFVEAAEAIGPPPAAHPIGATSAGLAPLLSPGCTVGLGGSATVDGGLGLLRALGLEVLDAAGGPARTLTDAAHLQGALPDGPAEVLTDVRTPLPRAIHLYGPQKGVPNDIIDEHQRALDRWAGVLNAWRQARGRPPLPVDLPGGGAAGGLGFALAAAFDLPLNPGAGEIARRTGLSDQRPDLVILGEGRLDASSFEGKVAEQVLALGCPAVALVGTARPPLPREIQVFEAGVPSLAAFDAATDRLGEWLSGPGRASITGCRSSC